MTPNKKKESGITESGERELKKKQSSETVDLLEDVGNATQQN